ncbi:MAG: transglutaminase family protein [Rhodobiaceae bacterium]|nr:transglutaminase family protein [Rhodobiaceae bacterium]
MIENSRLGPAQIEMQRLVEPGTFVDSDAESVISFASAALQSLDGASDKQRAIRLFDTVRDQIRYDPYRFSADMHDYRASVVAVADAAFCVPKAILLAACLRAAGIPAAVGFADVRNHLSSAKLKAAMKTDLFVYHGYVQLWLGDLSYKVTPAFNTELCERFGVKPLSFDGCSDALFHEFDVNGQRHMEYVNDHGIYEDVPIEMLLAVYRQTYPGFSDGASDLGRADADTAFAASVLK